MPSPGTACKEQPKRAHVTCWRAISVCRTNVSMNVTARKNYGPADKEVCEKEAEKREAAAK